MSKADRSLGFRDGARWAITWLHEHANEMNDPHAKTVLNTAAFQLGNHTSGAEPVYAPSANPDSALRQALEKARDALAPFADFVGASKAPDNTIITQQYRDGSPLLYDGFTMGDFRRAREAHAIITEALQRGEKT